MIVRLRSLVILAVVGFFFGYAGVAYATPPTASSDDINNSLNSFSGETGIQQETIFEAAGDGINLVYQVVGLIFFILAIYSGIRWMTAQGNESTIEEARDTLIAATIGMVVIVGAYGITTFITNRALGSLANDSQSLIQSGAGGGDGTNPDDPNPPGCCIFRTSNNVDTSWIQMYGARTDCEVEHASYGMETNSDTFVWEPTKSPEWCVQARSCYTTVHVGNVAEKKAACVAAIP